MVTISTLPEERRLAWRSFAGATLAGNWSSRHRYSAPSVPQYPWQWLWDSCFHAITWAALGDQRAVTELRTLFRMQLPNGFLPNMGYWSRPPIARLMWHQFGRSDITQPPMYGHALRILHRLGFEVDDLLPRATAAMEQLFRDRIDPATGLLRVLHPWETGCDDSPRWDSWMRHPFARAPWNVEKWLMVRTLVRRDGVATRNLLFDACPAGFNALVAFNARELSAVTGDRPLRAAADRLVAALERTWDPALHTWTDLRLGGGIWPSGRVRTLDGLLPLLVTEDREHASAALRSIFHKDAFWARYGPRGVSLQEGSTYDPERYWRGGAWPQLTYLLAVAGARLDRPAEVQRLRGALHREVMHSAGSEWSNADTGVGHGAPRQGWSTLAYALDVLLDRGVLVPEVRARRRAVVMGRRREAGSTMGRDVGGRG